MKRKIYIIVTIVLIAMLSLTACSASSNETSNETIEFAGFKPVPGYKNLFYDPETKSIYYMFSRTKGSVGGFSYGYGYFGPYIKNGHFCEYDGQIVEVHDDTNN